MARLKGAKRQKNQLELAFEGGTTSEAQSLPVEGTEAPVAKCSAENRAPDEQWMERVCQRENLWQALKRVRGNGGSPGVDGMTVEGLTDYLKQHWLAIRAQLLSGTYQAQPVRRVEIPKPDGGVRKLGIPTVLDRLIQQAVMQVLQRSWDHTFSESSYGFRPGRSAHMAAGFRWVVDLDLDKFFDRVNHDKLMSQVARRVKDKRLLHLIRGWLKAGGMENGLVGPTEEGTPQGGPLSPLLSNLVLDQLDRELERRGHRFVRYADDCNIYVRSRRAGHRLMGGLIRLLEGKLKLKVNREKSAVARPWERKLLGFSFTNGARPKRRIAPKAVLRFEARIRVLTRRTRGVSTNTMVFDLGRYLRGWQGYLASARHRACWTVSTSGSGVVYALPPVSNGGQGRPDTPDCDSSISVTILRLARQGINGVHGGLAAHRPSRSPCPPLTSITWASLVFTAQLVRNPSEPPCTDPYARWCDRESE